MTIAQSTTDLNNQYQTTADNENRQSITETRRLTPELKKQPLQYPKTDNED